MPAAATWTPPEWSDHTKRQKSYASGVAAVRVAFTSGLPLANIGSNRLNAKNGSPLNEWSHGKRTSNEYELQRRSNVASLTTFHADRKAFPINALSGLNTCVYPRIHTG